VRPLCFPETLTAFCRRAMSAASVPRIAFTTLGCKVNQSETDLLARQFVAAGYRCVEFSEDADVYVVNTCTVTHTADKKSRQMVSQARRANREALVVATGCYASIVGNQLADDRTLVIRNRDKDRVVALVDGRLRRVTPDSPSFSEIEKYIEVSGGQERTRAMVKAQDGCDSHCAYCIIPRARGRSRSVPAREIVRRVQALVDEGHGEIVITGVDLGSYGEDSPTLPDLGGLLEVILDETHVQRVRISSIEPGDFDPSWLRLWNDQRMCRHLHVPLQAGSDAVLRRMERRYSPEEYAHMVDTCRSMAPGITITTDVMVGFPGESDLEFEDGYRFILSIGFDGMHVFRYSQRAGTRAAHLEGQVREQEKARRSALLRAEGVAGVQRLVARHSGAVMDVAWESERDGIWRGLTDTNVRVYGSPEDGRSGQLSTVRLGAPFRDGVWSEPQSVEIALIPVS
jgi:threonylcarbamoyladenosine tRNA methylthiotransferase MtaB